MFVVSILSITTCNDSLTSTSDKEVFSLRTFTISFEFNSLPSKTQVRGKSNISNSSVSATSMSLSSKILVSIISSLISSFVSVASTSSSSSISSDSSINYNSSSSVSIMSGL